MKYRGQESFLRNFGENMTVEENLNKFRLLAYRVIQEETKDTIKDTELQFRRKAEGENERERERTV